MHRSLVKIIALASLSALVACGEQKPVVPPIADVAKVNAAAQAAADKEAPNAAKMWRIAILGNSPTTDPAVAGIYDVFFQTLRDRGYVEGKNLIIEQRFAEGRDERFPTLAAELVRLGPDVIVAGSGPATAAAKAASSTIPVVMGGVGDPVGRGLVTNLAHPGGNITGISNLQLDLINKRIELLKVAVPRVTRAVVIGNAGGIQPEMRATLWKGQDEAAKRFGVTLVRVELNAPTEWPGVKDTIVREGRDALVLSPAAINFSLRREIAEFANAQRLPTIGANRQQAEAGFLMSYGPESEEVARRAAEYVDKILRGAKPGDLPIEQPTKFDLVINLKTAKALGITIPQSLLLRADQIIQ